MTHLIFTVAVIAIFATLLLIQYRLTKSWFALIPSIIVYFWTLHGALRFCLDEVTGAEDVRYTYLFSVMFPVSLDETYLNAIFHYSFYAIVFQLTYMSLILRPMAELRHSKTLSISAANQWLPLLASAGLTIAFVIVYLPVIGESQIQNATLYSLQREELSTSDFVAASIFNKLAMFISGFALLTRSTKDSASSTYGLIDYTHLILLLPNIAIVLLGGQKAQLFSVLLPMIFFFHLLHDVSLLRACALGGLGALGIGAIDIFRSYSLDDWLTGNFDADTFDRVFTSGVGSNEAFGAHFSLYGIMNTGLSSDIGDGFLSLLTSFIPRFLDIDRSATLYEIYAAGMGFTTSQGFTLHNASGWFMEFGSVGVVVGGAFLALLIAVPLRLASAGTIGTFMSTVGFFFFALVIGEFPQFIRGAQVEPVKTWIFQFIFAVVLVFLFAPRFTQRHMRGDNLPLDASVAKLTSAPNAPHQRSRI